METFENFYEKHSNKRLKSRKSLPVGIKLLALYHFIRAIGLIIVLIPIGISAQNLTTRTSPPSIFIACILFLVIILIISGTGLWKGTRWGWWPAAIYHLYSIANYTSAQLVFFELYEQNGPKAHRPTQVHFEVAFNIFIHFMLLLYLFKSDVYKQLGMQSLSRTKSLTILIGITSLIFGFIYFLAAINIQK